VISITHTISGETIGRAMAEDVEEGAYALLHFARRVDIDDLRRAIEDICPDSLEVVALRELGKLLVAEEEETE
jgi:hypothetical protein